MTINLKQELKDFAGDTITVNEKPATLGELMTLAMTNIDFRQLKMRKQVAWDLLVKINQKEVSEVSFTPEEITTLTTIIDFAYQNPAVAIPVLNALKNEPV